MFQKPRVAKRLYFDVIPRAVDDYYQYVAAYNGQDAAAALENPAFHIHSGKVPVVDMPITFGLLLNLASAANAHEKAALWNYISRRLPAETPETNPELDRLAGYAVRYFNDEVKPTKTFRAPTDKERAALADLADRLAGKDVLDARNCRTSSTPSAMPTPSTRCATGSARSTRCCSAPIRARASVPSSPFTALPKPAS